MGGFLGGYISSSPIGGLGTGIGQPVTTGQSITTLGIGRSGQPGHIDWITTGYPAGHPAGYPGGVGQPGQIMVQLMDANGTNWQIHIDPSLVQLINTINQTHASKLGVQQYNPLLNPRHGPTTPNQSPPPKPLPIGDFSLDEIAQAEELMEELCGAA